MFSHWPDTLLGGRWKKGEVCGKMDCIRLQWSGGMNSLSAISRLVLARD